MPFYCKELDFLPEVAGLKSVLIVPCRFCPAASLAVKEKKPYIELFRRFLKTGPYEKYIQLLKESLEDSGITPTVFSSKFLHQFVACMWTSERRRELAKKAAKFDGVVVLGCEAAVEMVRESLKSLNVKVIRGMEIEGIMTVIPSLSFPLNISLKVQKISPVYTFDKSS